jgi:hydroxyacylglutathione hydrolase
MDTDDDIGTALSHPQLAAIPAFSDNVIWAFCSADGADCLVVDPGDAGPVREWLAASGRRLIAILVTHHHNDHCGGIAALNSDQVTVFGPRGEAINPLDVRVGGDDAFELRGLGVRVEVIDVPGHTAGHVAYVLRPLPSSASVEEPRALLFCGDTLFSAGCGRLFEGTAEQMFASLQALDRLPANTLVCCAHEYTTANLRFAMSVEPANNDISRMQFWAGNRRADGLATLPSSLARERRINPFLRAGEASVISAIANRGENASSPVRVFAALRRWKDAFR